MLQKMLVALICLGGVSAFAQAEKQSEMFHQVPAGKSAITPRVGYMSATTKAKGAASDSKLSGLYGTGVAYEYGLNETFSLEGSLTYTSIEDDRTPKSKLLGLNDPVIQLKGTTPSADSRVRYGVNLTLGLEKAKSKANGETTAASGGYSIAPYLGMDTDAGSGIVGGGIAYLYQLDRTVESETLARDVTIEGGNALVLMAFYEGFVNDTLYGGSFTYSSRDDSKSKTAGVTVNSKSSSTLGFKFYSRVAFDSMELIPSLNYDFSNSEYDKYDVLTLSLAARFGF